MTQQTRTVEPQQVSCEVCLKLVPRSEAASAEASDYVAYFCGLDCYDKWQRKLPAQPGPHEIQE